MLGLLAVSPGASVAQQVSPSLYVRTDSDHTTVISPRFRVRAPLEESTNLDFVYTVDVWTSASVDIVASASEAVTEQRDEIDVNVEHVLTDLTLSAGYRYSHEPDYISNGGHLNASLDLADKSTTLGLGVALSLDDVGRAGDPTFSRDATTFSVQTSLTQVIDPDTLIQALYDVSHVGGYQSSPYRRVGIGGTGLCAEGAPYCVDEANPDRRLRQALALRARRAFGQQLSAGAGYRFYIDNWGIASHTLHAALTFLPDAATLLALQYRAYFQTGADHYRARYPDVAAFGQFVTSDKELSALSSHRVLLDVEHVFVLDGSTNLRAGVSLGPTFYSYSDFVYLGSMRALDVTTSAVLEF